MKKSVVFAAIAALCFSASLAAAQPAPVDTTPPGADPAAVVVTTTPGCVTLEVTHTGMDTTQRTAIEREMLVNAMFATSVRGVGITADGIQACNGLGVEVVDGPDVLIYSMIRQGVVTFRVPATGNYTYVYAGMCLGPNAGIFFDNRDNLVVLEGTRISVALSVNPTVPPPAPGQCDH